MHTTTHCPICGHSEFEKVQQAPFWRGDQEPFQIESCTNCGFWLTNPRPEDDNLPEYYTKGNYVSHSDKGTSLFDRAYRLVRNYSLQRKLRLVKRLCEPAAKVIDFGAGGGAFLSVLQKANFRALGFEPSDVARENAVREYGVEVLHPSEFDQTAEEVQLISLWHVLEHLPKLNEHMDKFAHKLQSGGYLVLALPNRESYDAEVYGPNWAALDLPLHLWHFSKSDVVHLAEKHGFGLVEIHNLPFDSFYVSLISRGIGPKKGLLKALWIALVSNLKGRKHNQSSLIYVLKKH